MKKAWRTYGIPSNGLQCTLWESQKEKRERTESLKKKKKMAEVHLGINGLSLLGQKVQYGKEIRKRGQKGRSDNSSILLTLGVWRNCFSVLVMNCGRKSYTNHQFIINISQYSVSEGTSGTMIVWSFVKAEMTGAPCGIFLSRHLLFFFSPLFLPYTSFLSG